MRAVRADVRQGGGAEPVVKRPTITLAEAGKQPPGIGRSFSSDSNQVLIVSTRCPVPEEVRSVARGHALGGQVGSASFRYAVGMGYRAMTLADLARFIVAEAGFEGRWRLVVEFLKEFHHEPSATRAGLLLDAPPQTGDVRWDALIAGLAEHLAMRDGQSAPQWSGSAGLRRFWFPFDTPGARAQALVHAPAALRRRGVFVPDYEIDAA
jgi:hypothetical protein